MLPQVKQNTEKGHCQKTEAILKYFHKHATQEGWEWLVIVDDDTILGVQNLFHLLHHYDPKHPFVIGKRFGYALSQEKIGYNYLAGGAGMIFNSAIVSALMQNNGKYCSCPRPDEHDDMFLAGQCIKTINGYIINDNGFHQYSPSDYSPELLRFQKYPISFHKFYTINAEYGTLEWNDPKETYQTYFERADAFLKQYKNNKRIKTEL